MVSPCSTRSSPTFTTAVMRARVDVAAEGSQEPRGADATTENGYHPRNLRGAWVSSSVVSTLPSVGRLARQPQLVLFRLDDGAWRRPSRTTGDLDGGAPVGLGVQDGGGARVRRRGRLGACTSSPRTFGPRGATLANLLSHTQRPRTRGGRPGRRRRDQARLLELRRRPRGRGDRGENDARGRGWTTGSSSPFGMATTSSRGSSVVGRGRLDRGPGDAWRVAWLRPDGIARATRDRFITPVPAAISTASCRASAGSRPCPWGLGPEVRGDKQHWMGDWPPTSFGHFGQSGSLMLLERARADRRRRDEHRAVRPVGGRRCGREWTSDHASVGAWFVSRRDASGRTRPRRFAGVARQLDDRPRRRARAPRASANSCAFAPRAAPATPDETRLRASRALWAPLWRRSLGPSIDGLLPRGRRRARRGSGHAAHQVDAR